MCTGLAFVFLSVFFFNNSASKTILINREKERREEKNINSDANVPLPLSSDQNSVNIGNVNNFNQQVTEFVNGKINNQTAGTKEGTEEARIEEGNIRQLTIEEYKKNPELIKEFVKLENGKHETLSSEEAQQILLPKAVREYMEEGLWGTGLIDDLPEDADFITLEGYDKLIRTLFRRAADRKLISEEDYNRLLVGLSILNPEYRLGEAERVLASPKTLSAYQAYKPNSSNIQERKKNVLCENILLQGGGECYGEGYPDYILGRPNGWTCQCDECCICVEEECVWDGCKDACKQGGSDVYIWDPETMICGCGKLFLPVTLDDC